MISFYVTVVLYSIWLTVMMLLILRALGRQRRVLDRAKSQSISSSAPTFDEESLGGAGEPFRAAN